MTSKSLSQSIYLLDTRIQKAVYQQFIKKCKQAHIPVGKIYNNDITHVVSAFETIDDTLLRLNVSQESQEDIYNKVKFVKTQWLSECLKHGQIIEVEERHKLQSSSKFSGLLKVESSVNEDVEIHEWACMNSFPLEHHNQHLTNALEVLEKEAHFKGEMNVEENYARALAYRRCIATLIALPHKVRNMSNIKGLPRIGKHSQRVIEELLEQGTCEEVEHIRDSDFFKKQKLFTSIFGVGPKTAETWRKTHCFETLDDACKHESVRNSQDQRLIFGMAYHKDLNEPVMRPEALSMREYVASEIELIMPGASVELVGGFRRGKQTGHDIDILISHPEEGKEAGILPKLLSKLKSAGILIYGKYDHRHDTPEKLKDVLPGKTLASAHDEFEKWYGIVKIDETVLKTGNSNKEQALSSTSGCVINRDSDSDSEDGTALPAVKKRRVSESTQTTFDKEYAKANLPRNWLARRVDLVITPASQYYYALVGWTGSKFFNRDLRLYATRVLGMRLSSHALWDARNQKFLEAKSEKQVFENMNLEYREPMERNA